MLVESLSGIRGIFGTDLTERVVRQYGAAFGARIAASKNSSVAIGHDTRPSSSEISTWLVEECIRAGVKDVYVCGVASTGAMHIAIPVFKAGGGIVITASHNEPEWNGLKFVRDDSALLYPEEVTELISAAHAVTVSSDPVDTSRAIEVSRRLAQEYLLLLFRTLGDDAKEQITERGLTVLADANGGAASVYVKDFFDRLNVPLTYKGEAQGVFWRTIEPKPETLAPLLSALEIGKEDFAIAFDCDADRMELVMPKTSAFAKLGTPFVSGQYVLGLVVQAVLSGLSKEDAAKQVIVTNCATSHLVTEVAHRFGARVEEVDIGEINVVKRMQETGSKVGGEGSSAGGIIPPMAGRDGLMTLAVILRYLGRTGKTMDEALVDLPRYTTLQAKVTVEASQAIAVREKLISHMKKNCDLVQTFGDDGGVKCFHAEKEFVTFRMSKTENGVYRVIADAKDDARAMQLLEQGKKVLQELAG